MLPYTASLAAAFLLCAGSASATPMFDPCLGGDCSQVGVFAGNDNDASVSAALGVTVMQIAKVDDPPGVDSGVTVTAPDLFMGTWSSPSKAIDYVVAKAGPQFAIYDYVSFGAAFSGNWSSIDLLVGSRNQA